MPQRARYVHYRAWCVCSPGLLLVDRPDLPEFMLDQARQLAAGLLALHQLESHDAPENHYLDSTARPLDFAPARDATEQDTWPFGVESPYLAEHRRQRGRSVPLTRPLTRPLFLAGADELDERVDDPTPAPSPARWWAWLARLWRPRETADETATIAGGPTPDPLRSGSWRMSTNAHTPTFPPSTRRQRGA